MVEVGFHDTVYMEVIIVTGPAGSGKSTLCKGLKEFLLTLSKSSVVCNLDPGNECLQYSAGIDICELITLDDCCNTQGLGPNGGLLYCMEFLEKNISWLDSKLSPYTQDLVILDCPGQVELFTQHPVLVSIFKHLEDRFDCKMMVINLIDSLICANTHNFIAACLVSLSIMAHIELPHVNVLSKIDRLGEFYKEMKYGLEFFTDVGQLARLVSEEDMRCNGKMARVSKKLAEVVEDFGLVGFEVVSVNDRDCMMKLVKQIGRVLGSHLSYVETLAEFSVCERVDSIEERYSQGDV